VPKGPSYNPKIRRLAVHVEDHPLDYQTFEGTIPARQYGGGAVIVWDRGTYTNLTERDGRPVPMRAAIEQGHFSVWLEGLKLRGGWSFTRTSPDGQGKPGPRQGTWIMVKRRDETANEGVDIVTAQPNSVVSGRSLDEVAAG
jgi:DNA ligase D-like protein (predicted 3'-phosphoesterase)